MPRSTVLIAALLLWPLGASAQQGPLSAGPMVGATSHEGAAIWARGQRAGQALTVRVRPAQPADAPWRELPAAPFDHGAT